MRTALFSRRPVVLVPAVLVAVLIACRTGRAAGSDEMYELGAALTKLTAAVDVAVRYDSAVAGLKDDALIEAATKHDEDLRRPFRDYTLRATRRGKEALVLVCSKDGRVGLLEDAGCSFRLDSHLWQVSPAKPCEFTLDVSAACPAP